MSSRFWLALVGAPILGAAVYAGLTLVSLASVTLPGESPPPLSLVVSGALVGLVFELAVIVPVLFMLRRLRQLRVVSFVLVSSLAWFASCFLLMLLLGVGPSGASATAVVMFLPGLALVLAVWFVGVRGGA